MGQHSVWLRWRSGPAATRRPLRHPRPLPMRNQRRPRVRRPRTMANPPQPLRPDFGSIDVESFVHVPGGRELALLRLEGRYRSRLAQPLLEATLLVDDGLAIHRHEPLPQSAALDSAAADDEWLWRAAFAV